MVRTGKQKQVAVKFKTNQMHFVVWRPSAVNVEASFSQKPLQRKSARSGGGGGLGDGAARVVCDVSVESSVCEENYGRSHRKDYCKFPWKN